MQALHLNRKSKSEEYSGNDGGRIRDFREDGEGVGRHSSCKLLLSFIELNVPGSMKPPVMVTKSREII